MPSRVWAHRILAAAGAIASFAFCASLCAAAPVPTITLTATPTTITPTQLTSTIEWTTANAVSCTADSPSGWTAKTTPNGVEVVRPTTTTTYYLTCTGPGGSQIEVVTIYVPVPTITLTATPTTITPTQLTSTIEWTTANAVSCTADSPSGWTAKTTPNGVEVVRPTTTTTYYLTCTGPGGSQIEVVTIYATPGPDPGPGTPTLTFTATPPAITLGQSSALSWTSTDVTSCTASDGWTGSKPTSSTFPVVVAPSATTTYTLACTGPDGSPPAQSVTVTVAGDPGPGLSQSFATYLGGGGADAARDVYVDRAGYIYVTGGTSSANFPTTTGTVLTTDPAGQYTRDVFVSKFSPSGQIICSTLVGGPKFDQAYGIEVNEADSQKPIYIAGRAGPGFPTTPGTVQPAFAGDTAPNALYGPQDGFVAKLSNNCSQVLWATYFGNDGPDVLHDIAVDGSGNVYLAGQATRPNPHVSGGALQSTLKGSSDGLIAKLTPDGALAYATYLGGTGSDGAMSTIRVEAGGNVYYAMETQSTNTPVTAGAFQPTLRGSTDVWVGKLSADGSRLGYGTYVGGSGNESLHGHNLSIDGTGRAVLAATTTSADLPITQATTAGYQRTYGGTGGSGTGLNTDYPGDAFVVKLASDGSQLLGATYLGGLSGDGLQGSQVDAAGNVYVSGSTFSSNFPVSVNAAQGTNQGAGDGWVAKLSPDLSTLMFSTYIGGSGFDQVRALDVSPEGMPVVVGHTNSNNFPVSATAEQAALAGAEDGVVAKVEPPTNQPPAITFAGPTQSVQLPATASLSVLATDDGIPGPLTYQWSQVGGFGLATLSPRDAQGTTVTFSQAGVYTLRIVVSDGALSASADVAVTVTTAGQVNRGPIVSAGRDRANVPMTDGVQLGDASARDDDGLPNPPGQLTVTWSQVSGPANGARFTDASVVNTDVQFTSAGAYVLRLEATDGALSASDTLNVTVIDNTGGGTAKPTVTLSASPTRIAVGGSTTLTWTSTGADVCEGFGGQSEWAGPKPFSSPPGGQSLFPRETTTYELTCSNATGDTTQSVEIIVGNTPGAYSISAAPVQVSTIGSITATWNAQPAATTDVIALYALNPEQLISLQQNAQGLPTGSVVFTPGRENGWAPGTSFEIRYQVDIGGGVLETRATTNPPVTVRPDTYTLSARSDDPLNPSEVIIGGTITVQWSASPTRVNDTIACYLVSSADNQLTDCDRARTGLVSRDQETASGTLTFRAPDMIPGAEAFYEFRFLPSGRFVDSARSNPIKVIAIPPRILTFTATPGTIDLGESSTLSWTTQYARTCTASSTLGDWTGDKPINSSAEPPVQPSVTATYTLVCTNAAGNSPPSSVVVTVIQPVPTPTLWLAKKSPDGTMSPWVPSPNNDLRFFRGTGEQIFFKVTGTGSGKQVRIRWSNGGDDLPGEPWSNIFTDPNTGLPYTTNASGEVVMGPFPDANGVPNTDSLNCAAPGVTCWPPRPGYWSDVQAGDPVTNAWSEWSNQVVFEVADAPPTCDFNGPATVQVDQPFNVSWTVTGGPTVVRLLGSNGMFSVGPQGGPFLSACPPQPGSACTFTGLQLGWPGDAHIYLRVENSVGVDTCQYDVTGTDTPVGGLTVALSTTRTGGWTAGGLEVTRAATAGGNGDPIYIKITGGTPNSVVYFHWTNSVGIFYPAVTLPDPLRGMQPYQIDGAGSPLIAGPFPDAKGVPNSWSISAGYKIEAIVDGSTSNAASFSVWGTESLGSPPTCDLNGPASVQVGQPFNVSWTVTNSPTVVRLLSSSGPFSVSPQGQFQAICPPQPNSACTFTGLELGSPGQAHIYFRAENQAGASSCQYDVTGTTPQLTLRVGKTSASSTLPPTSWSSTASFSVSAHDKLWFQVSGNNASATTMDLEWSDSTGTTTPFRYSWATFTAANNATTTWIGPLPGAAGFPSDWPISNRWTVHARVNGVETNILTYTTTN